MPTVLLQKPASKKSTAAIEACFCNIITAPAKLRAKTQQKATLNKGKNLQPKHFLRCAAASDFLAYELLVFITLLNSSSSRSEVWLKNPL